MPEKTKQIAAPQGLSRLLFRFPLLLYRVGLGSLLGNRFLMLEHTGRVSGAARQTVLEVVRADEGSNTYYVASAWGENSDWYRNLKENPSARIQVQNRKLNVRATFLDVDETYDELFDYAVRNPSAARALSSFMGYRTDGSAEDFAQLSNDLRMVKFSPARSNNDFADSEDL